MIEIAHGNILEADAEALVNCVGVMGKGLALQFKRAFPANFKAYETACRSHEVVPGRMFILDNGRCTPPYVVNFPTKRHWRDNSRIDVLAVLGEVGARHYIKRDRWFFRSLVDFRFLFANASVTSSK